MINTDTLKTTIIDLAVSGKISSGFDIKDSVTDIISVLPAISNKRKNLLEQKFEYGKQPLIPPHWKWTRLGEITTYGDTPTKAYFDEIDSNTWLLDLEDIKTGGEVITKTRVQGKKFTGDKSVFRKDQVLYSKLRPYLKKVLVADEDGISTPELISFDVFGGIIPQYIVYCLLSTFTTKAIDKRSYGIKMPRVDAGFMVNLPIPLPPVSEQQYIVARVQAAFAQIDTIDKLQAQYSNNLSALKSKLVDLAIQGKLTEQNTDAESGTDLLNELIAEKECNIKKIEPDESSSFDAPFDLPRGWAWAQLEKLCDNIPNAFADGPFGSNLKKEHYTTDNQVRIIQLSNVGVNEWRNDNEKYTTFEHLETIKRSEVNVGNIVIAKMMPAGRAMVVPEGVARKFVLSSDCIKFVPHPRLNSRYLCYAINSKWFHDQVTKDVHGIGRERTSLSKLKKYCIPLPSVSEQQKIVNKLDELLSFVS